jgi:hypothetical protein
MPHHLDGLVESAWTFLGGDAEPGELAVPAALPNAEIQPPAGHEVHGRCLLGQQDGVMPGKGEHAGTEARRRGVHRRSLRRNGAGHTASPRFS